jgi:lysophospholipase L1-like esterase
MKAVNVANSILGATSLIGFITIFYSVRYYSWTPERYFPNQFSLIVFYVAPIILSAVSVISLRLKPTHRINLCLVFASIAVSFYGMEFVLMCWNLAAGETELAVERAKELGIAYDTRSKLEVVRDLRAQNIDAVVHVFPMAFLKQQADGAFVSALKTNGHETLPLGGVANKITVLGNENGEYVTYESDEHGFHNPKGIWNAGTVAVAAVGDSFTQGCCVASNKNFVALIRNSFPVTLNLGMVNNGPLIELATLKEYLPSLKPNLVLWVYFEGNDLRDLETERRSSLVRSYLRGSFSQRLLYRQAEIDRQIMLYLDTLMPLPIVRLQNREKELKFSSEIYRLVKLERLRVRLGLSSLGSYREDEAEAANLNLFRQVLAEAKTAVNSWNGTLRFVYLPEYTRYVYPKLASKHRNGVLELVRTMGIPIIDLHPTFERYRDPLLLFAFRLGTHYSEEGNRVVAEEVLRSLSK